MKYAILLLFIFHSVFCFSQENNLILTEKENELWLKKLNTIENLSEKINLINQRLKNDSNIYIEWSLPDGITVERIPVLDSLRKVRIKGFCKPLYILKYKSENLAFRFENPINDNKINSVIKLINIENIKSIELVDDETKALFGASDNCGIILMTTDKESISKGFEKLNLTFYYLEEILTY
ncbi:MAG: hypothetical protein COB73_02080 [Flavobacteriaceae bacterium]|nr:MAG: hypothetical protein COB73_02080 [Flavobacteriaceae bacterium]